MINSIVQLAFNYEITKVQGSILILTYNQKIQVIRRASDEIKYFIGRKLGKSGQFFLLLATYIVTLYRYSVKSHGFVAYLLKMKFLLDTRAKNCNHIV